VREKKKKLLRTIQNKRREILTSCVVFFHDDAHPHTASRIRALLGHFNWELFDHPSYNHELARNDYHLFTYLKNWFAITALQQ
jgi:hypothetical protein